MYVIQGIQLQLMEKKESNVISGILQKKVPRERKAAAKRERDKACYQPNKENKIVQVNEWWKKSATEK